MILDTHVLVWLALGDIRLGKKTRLLIDGAFQKREEVCVSAISFWEISMLVEKRRLVLDPAAFREQALRTGILEVSLDGKVAVSAGALKDFHGDPADRIVAATSLSLGAPLLTADRELLRWLRKHGGVVDAGR